MAKPLHTLTETLPDGTSFEMVLVEGGPFQMGSEKKNAWGLPVHEVQLRDYYLGRYPITQQIWKAVMDTDPEELAFPHPRRPVEWVSWYDAVEFCNRLSDQMGYQPVYSIDKDRPDPNNQNESDNIKWTVSLIEGSNGFHLPTEAEWEYAARGGRYAQAHAYAGSPNHNEVAWWNRTSQRFTQPVGLRIPNALGLFDMSGNLWEWVWDWYGSDYYEVCAREGLVPNPTGPKKGSSRRVRGGSWWLVELRLFQSPRGLSPHQRSLQPIQQYRFSCLPVLIARQGLPFSSITLLPFFTERSEVTIFF